MNFKELANSPVGESLIRYIEEIQAKIADVRFKPELTNETRIAVIEVLDKMIITKLKVLKGNKETAEGNDDWN